MRAWWKQPKFLGTIAYWFTKILTATLRIKITVNHKINPKAAYLFAFWHGKQFLPAPSVISLHQSAMCAMVSPSNDGAILAVMLQKIGYEVIRGSSRNSGTRALLSMKQKLEHGTSIGFGIDGPIGPIYKVKPGIAFLAQKCNIQIIPMGSAYSRYWVFNKAWDKFVLPKPFSKAVLVIGEPFSIAADLDIAEACLEVEQRLNAIEQQALALLN